MNSLLLHCQNDRDFDEFFSGKYNKLPFHDFYACFGDCVISIAHIGDCYTIKFKGPKEYLRWLPAVPTSSENVYFFGSATYDLDEISKLISYWFYFVCSLVDNFQFKSSLPIYIIIGNPQHQPIKFSFIYWRYRYRVLYYGFEFEPSLINSSHEFSVSKNFFKCFDDFKLLLKRFSDLYQLL